MGNYEEPAQYVYMCKITNLAHVSPIKTLKNLHKNERSDCASWLRLKWLRYDLLATLPLIGSVVERKCMIIALTIALKNDSKSGRPRGLFKASVIDCDSSKSLVPQRLVLATCMLQSSQN